MKQLSTIELLAEGSSSLLLPFISLVLFTLMPRFHACNVLQFLCNNCRRSNVMENIHEAQNVAAMNFFSITLESMQLLHKNCSALHAICST